jgi:hypothetical protein
MPSAITTTQCSPCAPGLALLPHHTAADVPFAACWSAACLLHLPSRLPSPAGRDQQDVSCEPDGGVHWHHDVHLPGKHSHRQGELLQATPYAAQRCSEPSVLRHFERQFCSVHSIFARAACIFSIASPRVTASACTMNRETTHCDMPASAPRGSLCSLQASCLDGIHCIELHDMHRCTRRFKLVTAPGPLQILYDA